MGVKEYYNNYLGSFYSWMLGDLQQKVNEFTTVLETNNVKAKKGAVALDMGCGHGIQSMALARGGFEVISVDFSNEMLYELINNVQGLLVTAVEDDIRNIRSYDHHKPSLITCCGDTIVHLASKQEVEDFIAGAANILEPNGMLLLHFRDYSTALDDTERFIPVRSTKDRILTCVLEYFDDKVRITDLLHERGKNGFVQHASSYYKVRLNKEDVEKMALKAGLQMRDISTDKPGYHLFVKI